MTLLRLQETTAAVGFPQRRVQSVYVECPHYGTGRGGHPGSVIHIWRGEPFTQSDGWPVWHAEVVREPDGDAPGVLRIRPSIGTHLAPRHSADCHLGPGYLPFVGTLLVE